MDITKDSKIAYKYCLRLLAKRDYSRKGIENKLKLREYEPDTIASTIEKLIEDNFLREDAYKNAKIRSLIGKNFSPNFIIKHLKQEEISVTINEVNQIYEDLNLSIEDQINTILQKKMPKKIPTDFLSKQKIKQKMYYQLVRKGHSIQDGKDILSNLLITKVC